MSTKSRTAPAVVRSRAEIRTDHPAVAWVIAAAVGAVALVSAIVSFYGLAQVSLWMGLPPSLRWTPAAILDGGAFAYTLAAYRRVSMGRSTVVQWGMVVLAAVVSAGANGAHVVLGQDGVSAQVVIGAALAGLAPVWSAAAAHQVGDLIAPSAPAAPTRAKATITPTTAATPTPTSPLPAPSRPASILDAPVRAVGRDTRSVPTAERAVLRERAVAMARAGSSRSQISAALGVGRSTVVSWTAGITAEPQREPVLAGQTIGANA